MQLCEADFSLQTEQLLPNTLNVSKELKASKEKKLKSSKQKKVNKEETEQLSKEELSPPTKDLELFTTGTFRVSVASLHLQRCRQRN